MLQSLSAGLKNKGGGGGGGGIKPPSSWSNTGMNILIHNI